MGRLQSAVARRCLHHVAGWERGTASVDLSSSGTERPENQGKVGEAPLTRGDLEGGHPKTYGECSVFTDMYVPVLTYPSNKSTMKINSEIKVPQIQWSPTFTAICGDQRRLFNVWSLPLPHPRRRAPRRRRSRRPPGSRLLLTRDG